MPWCVGVGVSNIGSLSGKREVCGELRKWMIDLCCLQEVRWRGQGTMLLWIEGSRQLWWYR